MNAVSRMEIDLFLRNLTNTILIWIDETWRQNNKLQLNAYYVNEMRVYYDIISLLLAKEYINTKKYS